MVVLFSGVKRGFRREPQPFRDRGLPSNSNSRWMRFHPQGPSGLRTLEDDFWRTREKPAGPLPHLFSYPGAAVASLEILPSG